MVRELLCTLGENGLGAEFLERDEDGSRPSGDGARGFDALEGDLAVYGGDEPQTTSPKFQSLPSLLEQEPWFEDVRESYRRSLGWHMFC
jgi:hypothetical protein